jgi:type I restriction enzyme S subunit
MDMLLEQFKILIDRPEKVKKLRELILQLAVRGKLVEQDENDEPAAVLLEKIREEKERLVKEGKIKKEKPLPEIREDEKPYELPKGWEWGRMNEIIDVRDGTHDSPKYIEDGGFPLVTGKDFYGGKLDFSKTKYIAKEDYEKIIMRSKVDKGDILYSMIGGNIGSMVLIENELEIAIKNVALFKRFMNNSFEPHYLMFYLKANLDTMKSMAKGGAQPFVSLAILRSYPFALPPLDEQKRIIEKVSTLISFCNDLEKQLERKAKYSSLSSKSVFNSIGNCSSAEELDETLRFIIENFKDLSISDGAVKELKNAILQVAVQGKLVQQDPTDEPASVLLERIKEEKERLIGEGTLKREKPLPEICEDEKFYKIHSCWEWTRLGGIVSFKNGLSKRSGKDGLDIPVIRLADINELQVKKNTDLRKIKLTEGEIDSYEISDQDLLLIRVNGTKDSVGRLALVNDDFDSRLAYCDHLMRVDFNKELLNCRFIWHMINSISIRQQVEKYITTTAGQNTINQGNLSKVLIPIPPLKEQERIVEKVDFLMGLCIELEKRIQKSQKYSEKFLEAVFKEVFKA